MSSDEQTAEPPRDDVKLHDRFWPVMSKVVRRCEDERLTSLIDKLKHQYEKAGGQPF